jgi:hypothetical protein
VLNQSYFTSIVWKHIEAYERHVGILCTNFAFFSTFVLHKILHSDESLKAAYKLANASTVHQIQYRVSTYTSTLLSLIEIGQVVWVLLLVDRQI